MKKIISIILALVLAASFAACARQAENGETTTAGESTTLSADEAEQALAKVGSADVKDKTGIAVAHGTQEGTVYENSTLGIKITPPESFESFAEEGEVQNPNNDYFVIELTENHDSVDYKTVKISVTENVPYGSSEDYITYINTSMDSLTALNAIGNVSIGGREYTCAKWDYSDSDEDNSVDYILVENGTLVILGFDQFTDSEITDFFANYIEQY